MMGTPAAVFAREVWKILSPDAKKITLISMGVMMVVVLCLDYNDKRKTEPDFKWWKYVKGDYAEVSTIETKPSPPLPKTTIKQIVLPFFIPVLICVVLVILIEIAGK
jgi:hypothetical protein